MPRHSLPKADLLDYALEGARTRRGVMSGALTEDEEDTLDADIRELERRIKQHRDKQWEACRQRQTQPGAAS